MSSNYTSFICFLFDRDDSASDWRFEIDSDEPDLEPREAVNFIARLLRSYKTDLGDFTDRQLGLGVDYIFNMACSSLSNHLLDELVPTKERMSGILALKDFFEECLNERCVGSLGHLSESGNELNYFCYMIWDTTPLACGDSSSKWMHTNTAIAEVMEFALYLDNIACVESGLHGLGHMKDVYGEAPKIVQKYIETVRAPDPRLLKYAEHAKIGYVL